jgi:hypothetical protein
LIDSRSVGEIMMRRHTLSLIAALSMLALTSPALAQNVLSVNAAPSAAGGTT